MKDTTEPLTDAELEALNEILLTRGFENADTLDAQGEDEGILNISELDGFVASTVGGPETIQLTTWLNAIWGALEPKWDTADTFEHYLSLLLRHKNSVTEALADPMDDYEPLLLEHEMDGDHYLIVDDWCAGYARGIALQAERWREADEKIHSLLAPITLFADEPGWKALDELPDEEVLDMQAEIPGIAQKLFDYWAQERKKEKAQKTALGAIHSVKPDDPCPCGSGKPFKKCCLH